MPDVSELQTAESATLNIIVSVVVVAAEWRGVWQVGRGQ